jgi:hypothetical protein
MRFAYFSCQRSAEPTLLKRFNIEHRTPSIERRALMPLRFIDFKTSEAHIFKG